MRLVFVYYLMNEGGSAQDIHRYSEVAARHGHELVVYGFDPESPFRLSRELKNADALIFAFEWTTELRYGDHLDLVRLFAQVPRERRFVIDCDGAYNDAIRVEGDYNHRDGAASQLWVDICDSISDKIYQPTYRPRKDNVNTFFFHAYDPAWEQPLDFSEKEFSMVYVGHSKFRWVPMYRVLKAAESVREELGPIALVGHGWDKIPSWAAPMKIEDCYYTDQEYLKQFDVAFIPQVPFDKVIDWMGKGIFSPVIYRPLFSRLKMVTCRTFETPAANTIPLFGLEPDYVKEIYGEQAIQLVLPADNPEGKLQDIYRHPEEYADVVMSIRRHLAAEHSYEVRFQQLLDIVAS